MLNEINNLKTELYNLIELQNQASDKSVEASVSKSNIILQLNNNNGILPNIENFFVINNKVMLVDNEKNLYHLKKCNKFQEYIKINPNKYETKEEIFNGFLEYYQNLTKNQIDNESLINKGIDEEEESNEIVDDNLLEKSEDSVNESIKENSLDLTKSD
jgi:hypothetical protein